MRPEAAGAEAAGAHREPARVPKPNIDPGRLPPDAAAANGGYPEPTRTTPLQPVVPPEAAFAHGWMPLASTGVNDFLRQHPDLRRTRAC